jgi:RNA polymerase sigma factor (sigma-70 family)
LFILLRAQGAYASLSQTDMPFNIIYAANDEMYSEENFHHKKKAVQRALAELTPRQKEAIYLRYMNRMSYEEICQIMDMNYQSARNLIFRAVEKMRLALAQTNFTLLLVLKHC